jgi:hypothetical protein
LQRSPLLSACRLAPILSPVEEPLPQPAAAAAQPTSPQSPALPSTHVAAKVPLRSAAAKLDAWQPPLRPLRGDSNEGQQGRSNAGLLARAPKSNAWAHVTLPPLGSRKAKLAEHTWQHLHNIGRQYRFALRTREVRCFRFCDPGSYVRCALDNTHGAAATLQLLGRYHNLQQNFTAFGLSNTSRREQVSASCDRAEIHFGQDFIESAVDSFERFELTNLSALDSCDIGNGGDHRALRDACAVHAVAFSSARLIDLRHKGLENSDMQRLREALRPMRQLISLDLGHNQLDDGCLQELLQDLEQFHPYLQSLQVHGNAFTLAGENSIVAALQDLREKPMGVRVQHSVGHLLAGELSQGQEAVQAGGTQPDIAAAVQACAAAVFTLQDGEAFARRLADAGTQTTADGQLFEALRCAEPYLMRVEELSFRGKRFTEDAFGALLLSLVAFCKNLRRLDLADCDLDEGSWHMLQRCLPCFLELRLVDLRGNPRAAGCDAALQTLSQQVPNLLRMGLPSVALPRSTELRLEELHPVEGRDGLAAHRKAMPSQWVMEEQRRLLHQMATDTLRKELRDACSDVLLGTRLSLMELRDSL